MTDDANFGLMLPIVAVSNHRNDAAIGKIYHVDLAVHGFHTLAQLQAGWLQMLLDEGEILGGQACQNTIATYVAACNEHRLAPLFPLRSDLNRELCHKVPDRPPLRCDVCALAYDWAWKPRCGKKNQAR